MPINCEYNKEKKVLFVTVRGDITLKDFEKVLIEIVKSTEFPSDTKTIWDFREINFLPLNIDFAEGLIAIRKKYPERGTAKVAFLTDSDLSFGMARAYETLSSLELPQQVKVFRDLSEAEVWVLSEE